MRPKRNWEKGFVLPKAEHQGKEKTPAEMAMYKKRRKILADLDEKEFLKKLGVSL